MSEYILEMDNICKSFSGVQVLHHVNLKVRKGTLHALMGENGAGKSTLMKILIGAHRADSGTIRFNGEDLEPSTLTVHQALGKGISMIFQELCLVPDMSVAENIFIGREPKIGKAGIVDRKKLIRQTQELLDSFEITFLRPTDSLRGMSTAKMQMIEICKALSYHSKLIIMDDRKIQRRLLCRLSGRRHRLRRDGSGRQRSFPVRQAHKRGRSARPDV